MRVLSPSHPFYSNLNHINSCSPNRSPSGFAGNRIFLDADDYFYFLLALSFPLGCYDRQPNHPEAPVVATITTPPIEESTDHGSLRQIFEMTPYGFSASSLLADYNASVLMCLSSHLFPLIVTPFLIMSIVWFSSPMYPDCFILVQVSVPSLANFAF